MVLIAHVLGSLYGLLAVVFGAFGAHALKKTLNEQQLKSFPDLSPLNLVRFQTTDIQCFSVLF